MFLNDFHSFYGNLFSNSTNGVSGYCRPSVTSCHPRHSEQPQRADAAHAKAKQHLGQVGCRDAVEQQHQHPGQFPAEAEQERADPGLAQLAAVGRFRQPKGADHRRKEHQRGQHLPDHGSRLHPVPAGAVLHKAAQHPPVEHRRAKHRRGHAPAGQTVFSLMRPAAAQSDQPDSAHQLQHGTHQRANAGHAHCQTHRTGQADTHAAQHRCDPHRPARTAQNKGLAGQFPGGNDANDQRRPQAAVPQNPPYTGRYSSPSTGQDQARAQWQGHHHR